MNHEPPDAKFYGAMAALFLAVAGLINTWSGKVAVEAKIGRCEELHQVYQGAIQAMADAYMKGGNRQ